MRAAAKAKTSTGIKGYRLVREVVRHSGRNEPFRKIKAQKRLAYALFEAEDMEAGHSKIDEALKKRAGAPTYMALLERARELNLLPPQGPTNMDPEFYQSHIDAIAQSGLRRDSEED